MLFRLGAWPSKASTIFSQRNIFPSLLVCIWVRILVCSVLPVYSARLCSRLMLSRGVGCFGDLGRSAFVRRCSGLGFFEGRDLRETFWRENFFLGDSPRRSLFCAKDTRRLASRKISVGAMEKLEKFYITTAINYTNGPAHIGHAYEAITSDILARYHRRWGRKVFFLTGTDEHGQKIASTAEKSGETPQELCDRYACGFRNLDETLEVSFDRFIRTTEEDHKRCCQELWRRVTEKGDIYLSNYEGWYNVREETFVTELEAKNANYVDCVSGVPLKKMKEESYFFRMSAYQDRLLEHIRTHEDFILPANRRAEILFRLENDSLNDLSVSRKNFSWGVEVPDCANGHVMYVWFDALTNYLSGVEYFEEGKKKNFWPADVHVVGKDISWFHAVIWPCMLMSAEIELPRTIFAHGFVTAHDGRKMSKSLGNVIDPVATVKEFGSDVFRYYIAAEAKFGADMKFDRFTLITKLNTDLADTLGNLISRTTALVNKYFLLTIPPLDIKESLPVEHLNVKKTIQLIDAKMRKLEIQESLQLAIQFLKNCNLYLTQMEPWKCVSESVRGHIIRVALESTFVGAHLMSAFVPTSMEKFVCETLKYHFLPISELSGNFDNLPEAHVIRLPSALCFEKMKEPSVEHPVQNMEIRVGQIREISTHSGSPHFFVCKIAVHPEQLVQKVESIAPTIVARKYLPHTEILKFEEAAKLQGDISHIFPQKVLLICNLKPVNVKGLLSHHLLLLAKITQQKDAEKDNQKNDKNNQKNGKSEKNYQKKNGPKNPENCLKNNEQNDEKNNDQETNKKNTEQNNNKKTNEQNNEKNEDEDWKEHMNTNIVIRPPETAEIGQLVQVESLPPILKSSNKVTVADIKSQQLITDEHQNITFKKPNKADQLPLLSQSIPLSLPLPTNTPPLNLQLLPIT